jgi:hypothetical protein
MLETIAANRGSSIITSAVCAQAQKPSQSRSAQLGGGRGIAPAACENQWFLAIASKVGLGDVRLRLQVVTKTKLPVVQVADLERGPRDEDDFLRTAVGVLRAVDAGVAYPVRGWACRGCQYSYACKPNRPKLALVP